MSSQTHRRLAAVALVGGLALAAGACGSTSSSGNSTATTAPAAAAADMVTAIPNLTGVGTTVTLDAGTAAALTSLHVAVAPFGTATAAKTAAGATAVTFPITSGYAEIHSDTNYKPGNILGSIQHYGSGLTFSAGGKTLTVSDFVVDPGNSMLYGTVGTTPDVPLLTLDGTAVKVSMSNGDVVLDGTVAKLTQTAATALDTTFGTTAVKAGLPLGTVHLVADAAGATKYSEATDKTTDITRLSGKSTSVTLAPTTLAALKSLGVAAAPTGTGTFDAATGTVGFPITGGMAVIHSDHSYQPGYIAGVLIHQGSGLTFSKGDKSLALTDFVVDPGNSTLTATVGGKVGVEIATLNGAPVQVSMVDGTVHLDGTIVNLTQGAATALDTTFGTTAVKAGLELGIAHIIAAGS